MTRAHNLLVSCLACAPIAAQEADLRELLDDMAARDSRIWSEAMERLVARGADAVSSLEAIVRRRSSEPDDACVRAVRVLHRIGEPAKRAIPVLLKALEESAEDQHFRKAVVLALGALAPHSPESRPRIRVAMLDLLAGEDLTQMGIILQAVDFLDVYATHARTLIGPETSEADLLPHLTSDNPFLREYACELFEQMTAASSKSVAALHAAAKNDHPRQVMPGDLGLGNGRPLDVYLDKRIQVAAARALVKLAPDDPRSIDGFTLLLERPDTEARLAAVLALRHAGDNAAPLLPQLMRMARREEPEIRREAVTALGMLGGAAEDAVALLDQLANDPDRQVAERARAALRQIRK